MDAELRLQKGLLQADRGDHAGAVATVRDVVAETAASPLRARALVVLGDLLAAADAADAARAALVEGLSVVAGLSDDVADLLQVETRRARELLGELA